MQSKIGPGQFSSFCFELFATGWSLLPAPRQRKRSYATDCFRAGQLLNFGWLFTTYSEDDEYTAASKWLASFINMCLSPPCNAQEKEARYHDAIKNQAQGEGLQAYKLEKLSRYETHLDRKFERSVGMLIKLMELRGTRLA